MKIGKTGNRMREGRRGSSRMNREQGLSRRRCRTVMVEMRERNRMGRVGHARRNALDGRTHCPSNRKQPKESPRVP